MKKFFCLILASVFLCLLSVVLDLPVVSAYFRHLVLAVLEYKLPSKTNTRWHLHYLKQM